MTSCLTRESLDKTMMQKCPFAFAIITVRVACRLAEQVVQRGGSEHDCRF